MYLMKQTLSVGVSRKPLPMEVYKKFSSRGKRKILSRSSKGDYQDSKQHFGISSKHMKGFLIISLV